MSTQARIYIYPSCTTCKKALKWLRENKIDFQLIDIVQETPSKDLLVEAITQIGNRKSVFNTSGLSYRALGANTVQSMTDEEALQALISDGKLIKRPFLITQQGEILVGFKTEQWKEAFRK